MGHVAPEALAGGPMGKVRDGDRNRLEGVGADGREFGLEEGGQVLAERPADTRLRLTTRNAATTGSPQWAGGWRKKRLSSWPTCCASCAPKDLLPKARPA